MYYEDKNGTQTLLGETDGTDDGYKPFSNNKYTIDFKDNNVTISYYYGSNDVWKLINLTYHSNNLRSLYVIIRLSHTY